MSPAGRQEVAAARTALARGSTLGDDERASLEALLPNPRAEERASLLLVAPCSAAVVNSAGPHDTTPFAADHLEGHAITLRPEVVRVILDHPPTRVAQRRAVVLQHIDVLGQHERPVAATDTTCATTTEVSDMLDRLERLLGLARCP